MEAESSVEKYNNTKSKTYNIEGRNPIALRWRVFKPKEPIIDNPDHVSGIIYMPGWVIPSGGHAVEPLCEQYADVSGKPVFAVEALGDPKALLQADAAEATRQFIIENNLTEVTIIGNSQAGVRAIDTVALLHEINPQINVNGLILDASMGLYDQSVIGILMRLAKDVVNTKKLVNQPGNEELKKAFDVQMEESQVEFNEQMKAGGGILNIPQGVKNLGRDMGKRHPRLELVDVPVVLLQGIEDPLSNPQKIVPPELGLQGAKEYAKKLKEHRKNSAEVQEPESVVTGRTEFLLRELLPNSKGVKMIIAEKLGVHGLPYLRYRQAALGTLIALERLNGIRGNKTKLNTGAKKQ